MASPISLVNRIEQETISCSNPTSQIIEGSGLERVHCNQAQKEFEVQKDGQPDYRLQRIGLSREPSREFISYVNDSSSLLGFTKSSPMFKSEHSKLFRKKTCGSRKKILKHRRPHDAIKNLSEDLTVLDRSHGVSKKGDNLVMFSYDALQQSEHDNKSYDSSGPSYDVVIVPNNYPEVFLTRQHMEMLSQQIIHQMDLYDFKDEMTPQFCGYKIRYGGCILSCHNMATKNWVTWLVPSLSIEGISKLKAVGPENLVKYFKAEVFFPGRGPLTPELTQERLIRQNPNLDVNLWSIVEFQPDRDGYLGSFWIPESVLPELKSLEYLIFYNLGKLRVRVLKVPNAKNRCIASSFDDESRAIHSNEIAVSCNSGTSSLRPVRGPSHIGRGTSHISHIHAVPFHEFDGCKRKDHTKIREDFEDLTKEINDPWGPPPKFTSWENII